MLQKLFRTTLAMRIRIDPDMINISIQSFDFLFWREKKIGLRFWKILWETDKLYSKYSQLECVYLKFKIWNFVCLFPTIFSKIWVQFFFHVKIENKSFSIDGLIICVSFLGFNQEKQQKKQFIKSVKNVNWAHFWISPLSVHILPLPPPPKKNKKKQVFDQKIYFFDLTKYCF